METRYVDDKDGTVFDTKTGLVWQSGHTGPMPWQEARDYAQNLDLAGHKDWRIPSIEELTTLVDYNRYKPASVFPGMAPYYFWSSSSYAADTSFAWFVGFGSGFVYTTGKSANYYVRCVRGGKRMEDLNDKSKA